MKNQKMTSQEFRKLVKDQKVKRIRIRPYKPNGGRQTANGHESKVEGAATKDRSAEGKKTGKKPKVKPCRSTPQLDEMDAWMKALGIRFDKEYKFSPDRNYRADRYLPDHSILIEYEGLFSAKSRHLTFQGYTEDCRKYNLATSLGFKVYRYTAKNYPELIDLLKTLVKS